MSNDLSVWVFNGAKSKFPSAVFSSKELAEIWIAKYSLTGILTLYPIDISVYEWSQNKGYFTPQGDKQKSTEFIQCFSSASQEHYHYEDGHIA